jgi:flavin reductase (DIM6/NTAB) family NADH-FMN oxidoreductase RutF
MKKAMGGKPYLYPMPTTLVGAIVDGKPNFEAIAFCGIVESRPARIAVTSGTRHYTNAGIKAQGTFSVNLPSADMVAVTDYCGIVSGRNVDKSSLFEVFFGTLETAPMIAQCPICMECRLVSTLESDVHDVFIGEIVETYIEESVLDSNGTPDILKVDPIIYSHFQSGYWRVGAYLGDAFRIGKMHQPE